MDNGLYLMITPYPGHGLKIKTSSGTIVDTDTIKSDSILGEFCSSELSKSLVSISTQKMIINSTLIRAYLISRSLDCFTKFFNFSFDGTRFS